MSDRLRTTRKLLLTTVAVATVVGPVALGIANAPAVLQQSRSAITCGGRASFEVASIRLDHSTEGYFDSRITPGRFVMERVQVSDLIEYAYDLKPAQLIGGPKWINSEKYDIEARVDDSAVAREQELPAEQHVCLTRLRVQDLLVSRFRLSVHHSMKRLSVLALMLAKGGPKFSQATGLANPSGDGGKPTAQVNMTTDGKQWTLHLDGMPLRYLILALSGQPELAGRVVVDKTGLTGDYAFSLQWAPQPLEAGPSPVASPSGPTLFTALQEQLGLKLESRKEPVDMVVIDHVERPSEN